MLITFQLDKIQMGTINVVNNIKNNDIPSTPKLKFMFEKDNHDTLIKYWNLFVVLSKPIHKKVEKKNVKIEKVNVNNFNFTLFFSLTKKRLIIVKKRTKNMT